MGTISTPLLILLAIHINLSISQRNQTECTSEFKKILNCQCYREEHYLFPERFSPKDLLYCPDLDKDVKLRFSEDVFEIVCATPKQFRWKIFPAIKLGSILHIKFDNCSLPENDTLSQIVEHFGTEELRTFKANNVKNSLDAQFFNGLQHLHILYLSKNQITELNENMFKSIGNLIWLDLSKNDLENLESGVFKYLNNLLMLDLSYNKLKRLSKDTFKGLVSLTSLELSGNDLKILPNDVFYNLPNLRAFSMGSSNNTFNISDGIFATNKELIDIRITENALIKIPNGFLSNLTNLKRVRIENSNVTYIPHDLLNGSVNIEKLLFCGSQVRSLPLKLFAHQSKMTNLTLSGNELTELQDGLFDDMKALEELALSDNKLTTISEFTFRGLYNLRGIALDGNQLKTIDRDAFTKLIQLEVASLKNNHLSFDVRNWPFLYIFNLEKLYLNGNNITTFINHFYSSNLHTLDLGSNHISSLKYEDLEFRSKMIAVNLTGNMIKNIDFPSNPSVIENDSNVLLRLKDNPFNCDCSMYYFLKYLQTRKTQDKVRMEDANELICVSPTSAIRQNINSEDFTCAVDYSKVQCPSNCQCRRRPSDNAFIFNCSNAALQVVPDIPNIEKVDFAFIVVDIHNNSLTELPKLGNNSQVAVIYASSNHINEIKHENLPPNLRYLDICANRIHILGTDVINFLKSVAKLALGKNPWLCCSPEAKELIEFVNGNNNSITDLNEIKCQDLDAIVLTSSSKLVDDLCSIQLGSVLLAASAFLIVALCISTLYYKYNQLIKIWLYSHNLCVWCVDEEELDKGKAFDAFISYSHHDEDFAIDTIVDELENGTPKFNMCVHARDWLPGALISESIAESVANSRRTIIILSRNYLNSMWGQHEFNCAHGIAVTEKRMRVIIIIYGDIGDIELLDPTLKSYLKTNTYLEWGDKWFWKKLRYALTHKNFK